MSRIEFLTEVYEGWDPLLVYHVDSKYYLADGYHRITAAERLGLETVQAEVLDGTFEDALLAGIKANSEHRGLPLTLKERKRAAELLLKTHTNWADNRIARLVNMSKNTVANIRRELESRGEIVRVDKVERSDGKSAPAHGVKMTPSQPFETEIEPLPPPWQGKVFCPADAFDILPEEHNHRREKALLSRRLHDAKSPKIRQYISYEVLTKWRPLLSAKTNILFG